MQTEIQSLTTKTAPFTGTAVDISGFLGDVTVVVDVQASGPDTSARFAFKDSAGLAGPTFVAPNGISLSATCRFTWRKYDVPNVPFGIADATLQLDLTEISGTNPSITYKAWIEGPNTL